MNSYIEQAKAYILTRNISKLKGMLSSHSWLFHALHIDGWPLMHMCLDSGCSDGELVSLYLHSGGDVLSKTPGGESLLFCAETGSLSMENRTTTIEALISAGAVMSAFEHIYVICGSGIEEPELIEVIKHRVAVDPSLIEERGYNGFTLLHKAVWNSRLDMVRLCLTSGSNPNALSYNLRSPLGMLPFPPLGIGNDHLIQAELEKSGARLTRREELGHLIRAGEVENVINMLKSNTKMVHATEPIGLPWLHVAVMCENIVMVKALIDVGVAVDACDQDGNIGLHLACNSIEPCANIVELLLNYRSPIDAMNKYRRTPLHMATGHPDHVKLLVEAGAAVNARDIYGDTPLDRVYRNRDIWYREVGRYLKDHGGETHVIRLTK